MRRIFFVVFLGALSPLATANNFLDISFTTTKFNYQEHSSTNTKLNSENGFMPGFLAGYGYAYENIGLNLTMGYHKGAINYQGQSQAGIPLNSSTDTQFTNIGTELFYYPFSPTLGIYTKFQWLEWQRHIQETNQTLALHETYQWQNIEAGFMAPVFQRHDHKLELKLGVIYAKNAQVKVNLSSLGYGRPILDIGNGSGLSVLLSYHFKLSEVHRFTLGLAYKRWGFSRSESKSVVNNNHAIIITEPESDSQTTSLFLSYRFNLNKIFNAK